MRTRSCWLLAALWVWSATAQPAQAERAERSKAEKSKAERPKAERSKAARSKAARSKAERSKKERGRGGEDGEPEVTPISVSLVAGYGHTFDAHQHLNPLGVGFGVRGGYNIDAFYLGLRFLFFLGDSERVETVTATGTERFEISANSMTLGLEGGYDLPILRGMLLIRPELGVGLVIGSAEAMVAGAAAPGWPTNDDSSEDLYISAGFALLVNLSERVFVGLDAQTPIIFDTETEVALTVLGLGGMHF